MQTYVFFASIRPLRDESVFRRLYTLASPARKAKIDRCRFEEDRLRSLGAEALLYYACKQNGFAPVPPRYSYEKHGKPYFSEQNGAFFNLSHSGEYAMLAVSDAPVGCDIETVRPTDLRTARRILTAEEYAEIKKHPVLGNQILSSISDYPYISIAAHYHHERYDGKGYPDHLKGEEIPLYGRIISIADAFDAMTANRVYRKRQDFDYVMGELHKGRGTQFDPDLLDIFLKLIDDKVIDIDALYANAPSAPEDKKEEDKA